MKYMEPRQNVALSDDMATNPEETDAAVSARVRALRRVMKPGMGRREYAENFLEVGYTRYFNVENGSPLGRDLAGIIRRKIPAITTDWLYYKDGRGMHHDFLQALSEAIENEEGNDNTEAGS